MAQVFSKSMNVVARISLLGIPLLFVSSTQINAQLPFNIEGNSQMVLKTPGGNSDNCSSGA